ncbi:MAG: copper amine oxidase N-terminal domain-containing protein [Candidatus Ornithomonoglobus sp.]
MNKKIISILSATALMSAAMPWALAANSDFAGGVYSSTDISGIGTAKLTIYSCDNSTITAGFERTDSKGRVLTFVCDPGTVSGSSASIPFTMTASGVTYYGYISLTLNGNGDGVTINTNATNYGSVFNGYLPKTANVNGAAAVQTAPAAANTSASATAAPISEDITINVNGEKMNFTEDAKPVIIEDHTYVPLRSVFVSMGINVYWDEYSMSSRLHEQLITCTKNDKILQFARTLNVEGTNVWTLREWDNAFTDSSGYTEINAEEYQPVLKGESSYVPIRVISEAMGGTVNWDEATRTVDITCDTGNAYRKSAEEIAGMEDFLKENARAFIDEEIIVVDEVRTPYFTSDKKFYKFKLQDGDGTVTVRVFNDGTTENIE